MTSQREIIKPCSYCVSIKFIGEGPKNHSPASDSNLPCHEAMP